jgi:predicted SnoaL-like aldol condensation-catalyzing enzyme
MGEFWPSGGKRYRRGIFFHFNNLREVIVNDKAAPVNPNRKEAAKEFLRLVSAGKIYEAFHTYTGPHFRHHNPYFRGDAESLIVAMEENAAKNPHQEIQIHHALEDGDFVAVHSQVVPKPDDLGMAVVHVFKFEGQTISELWDIGQPVPEDSPNENDMF